MAEDSVLLREGLVRLIEDGDASVVAAVGDGPSLVAAVTEHRPDVSVVDVRMPPSQRDEGLREVIAAMAEGRTNAGIASHLTITEGAAEKHISSIFSKLDLPESTDGLRRVLAVLAYLDSGL